VRGCTKKSFPDLPNDFIAAIIGTNEDLSALLINLRKLLHCNLKVT
jgi:hypothetical protein